MNYIEIKNGILFINSVEVPFGVVNRIITEEIDNEILADLRNEESRN